MVFWFHFGQLVGFFFNLHVIHVFKFWLVCTNDIVIAFQDDDHAIIMQNFAIENILETYIFIYIWCLINYLTCLYVILCLLPWSRWFICRGFSRTASGSTIVVIEIMSIWIGLIMNWSVKITKIIIKLNRKCNICISVISIAIFISKQCSEHKNRSYTPSVALGCDKIRHLDGP